MTLVVGIQTADGVWLAGDRICGGDIVMRGSKVHGMHGPLHTHRPIQNHWAEDTQTRIRRQNEATFEIGVAFAGSARVAQAVLRLELPPRNPADTSLELWLTCLADTIHDRLRDCGLMRDDNGDEPPFMAGGTDIIIAAERRVFLMPHTLHWFEPESGFVATGVADDTWKGAYLALTGAATNHNVERAKTAWRVAQQLHPIGPPVDELLFPG